MFLVFSAEFLNPLPVVKQKPVIFDVYINDVRIFFYILKFTNTTIYRPLSHAITKGIH